MDIIKKIDKNLEIWILSVVYLLLCVLAIAQVVCRYVINYSIPWSQEILTYALIWSAFIGVSIAVKRRRHLKVEVMAVLLPAGAKFYLRLFSNLAFMVFAVIICYYSSLEVYSLKNIFPQVAPASRTPMWVVRLALAAGFGLTFIRLIQDTILLFKEREAKTKGGGK